MRTCYVLGAWLLLFVAPAQAQTFFSAVLTPEQETGTVTSNGHGTAALALTDAGLQFVITVDGLTGPIQAAHFHQAPPGSDGPVVRSITFEGNTANGTWTATDAQPLTAELITALLLGEIYINIHTAQYPAGEIRGQVRLSGGTALHAALTPEQEPNGVSSSGRGTAHMTLTEAGLVYQITVDDLTGPVQAAHFHYGAAGVNGPVVHTISFGSNTTTGVWRDLPDSLLIALLLGNLYINIHTAQYPGGEIRGQTQLSSGTSAVVSLDPMQQSGAVTSNGRGTAFLALTEAGLVYQITVTGLTGPVQAAHFHQAPAGQDGPVVRTITFSGNTASGVWRPTDPEPLTDALIRELLAGNIYLNIHTAQYPAGEIRGQIRPGQLVLTALESLAGEPPATLTLAPNYPNPFRDRTTITFALPRATRATLAVYNLLGQRVATLVDGFLPAGRFQVVFDAFALPTGLYQYRLETPRGHLSRMLMHLR
ncbi:CHRD domain-containing protein [Rhodothermus profundi]|uniref:Por secretion system C-terminal sorting domain-containing protein n=1 Tax=Rhodothermus profundi TaxID=633813 RepID=A0A1M6SH37_9BACT|nr:CHRD domain-containing protein [Rhodothermus profundi]SHK43897.1 Por secretion system C-terminal sorting domain-containing protein [Rhodothermus profundi]